MEFLTFLVTIQVLLVLDQQYILIMIQTSFKILDNYKIKISNEIFVIVKNNLLLQGINENFHLIASPMKALKAAANLAKKGFSYYS